ncbi:CaiB/BaiF CoA-transferase family protein [Arthrobacter rhombi]|uniref:CaiB/BaiF CoA transferase family protein n=1 Tax=Arthrobacter rhombi TaxID=71253 RepID=UPI0031E3A133
MSTSQRLPLKGVRVIDFSQVQFGPMATQILADFGAEVIKVERPAVGDISRSIDVKSEGIEDSAMFLALNRNKRSISLDMKEPGALPIVHRMLEGADVIVSNYRAGVAERMGLGFEELHKKFPRLIYASGTGFGEDGPLTELGGQDMALQAFSGATWHNRATDGRPAIYPIPFIDFGAGMALVQGILLALIERGVSGQGQRVDVSLLDTAMFEQMQEYTAWMMRRFEVHWERDNLVGSFKTSDGWVTIVGLFRPDPLRAICTALGTEDLTARNEFSTAELQQENREQLWHILDEKISEFSTEEAIQRLGKSGVICGPVQDFDQVLQNPQVLHNDIVRSLPHATLGEVRVIDNPIRLSGVRKDTYQAAPLLGEHTEEVLGEFGYSPDEITAFVSNGVAVQA